MNVYLNGALTLAFAAGLAHRRPRRLGAALFGSFGAMMIAHGALPCDAGCEFVTPTGTAHDLLGMAGFTAGTLQRMFVAMFLTWMFATAVRELRVSRRQHAD